MMLGEASLERGESLAAAFGEDVREAHFDFALSRWFVVPQRQETAACMRDSQIATVFAPHGSPYDDDLGTILHM